MTKKKSPKESKAEPAGESSKGIKKGRHKKDFFSSFTQTHTHKESVAVGNGRRSRSALVQAYSATSKTEGLL